MGRLNLMRKIEREAKMCKRCELYKERKYVVFGCGNLNTEVIFIGEAPGKNEDEVGIPFCGKAGKILDNLLKSISIKRENIYITSVLKCRPPKNRKPTKIEIENCGVYLKKQIQIINPKIICCLGNISLNFILKNFSIKEKKQISKVHGEVIEKNNVKILPFFHPAYAIYNPKAIKIMERDFKKLKELIC
jgi:DNA polymerase